MKLEKGLISIGCTLETVSKYAPIFEEYFDIRGIVNPFEAAHFVAQCAHESALFKRFEENLNYSASALQKTWPLRFPDQETALRYSRKPMEIANKVYGDRMGNRGTDTGDGWNYRGRGVIQLTGRQNYDAAGKALGINLLENPNLLLEPVIGIKVAGWFWDTNNIWNAASVNSVERVTRLINGGLNGLPERKRFTEILCKALI